MKRKLKYSVIGICSLFILLNILIAVHSYSFTHFKEHALPLPVKSLDISFYQKVKIALLGVSLPKPRATTYPDKYDELTISQEEDKNLCAWHIKTDSLRLGVVILFHGYKEEKSAMLPKANKILDMGYDVVLVDFMGAGESYRNQCTIGYLEADNVVSAYKYVSSNIAPEEKIFLHGFSMGAVAVIKAQSENPMLIDGLIIEAPFSTFKTTVASRATLLGVPKEPTSSLFTFWIGTVNGYNAFDFKPIDFAKNITVPVLHMCGAEDQYISPDESKAIYDAIASKQKNLHLFENSKHENYLLQHDEEWTSLVSDFLHGKN